MAEERGAGDTIGELKELLVTYAKQQTVDPVKSLGRYLGFGLAGSLCMGLAGIFLPLALLRALQAETDTALTGNWSWVPYAITFLVTALVVALIVWRLVKVKDEQQSKVTPAHAAAGRSEP